MNDSTVIVMEIVQHTCSNYFLLSKLLPKVINETFRKLSDDVSDPESDLQVM